VVSTLAGDPGPGGYGYANGRGRAARFGQPGALAWLPEGGLLVFDGGNGCLRRVSAQGEVSLWGGRANGERRGTGPGEALEVSNVDYMAAAPDGTVYLVSGESKERHTIRRILTNRTEPARPWAGQPGIDARGTIDAATPGKAHFNFPEALAVAPNGTLYVAERGSRLVRTIGPTGRVATYAGELPRPSFDGQGARAELARPRGLALTPYGHLLVADYGHDLLRRIDASGNVTTVAGQFRPSDALDTTPEAERQKTRLRGPAAVAVAPDGTIYLACANEHVIRKLDPQGRLTVWAGQPGQSGRADDGLRGRGKLTAPTSLALAPDGTLYCTDEETQAVRSISPTGRLGTLQGGRRTWVGPFSNAGRTVYPTAVAVGPDGAVYVLQGTLHRYPPGRGRARLLAGSTEPGYQDGRGAAARFNYPTGLCVAADGTVYVADFGNQLVRRVGAEGEVTTLAGEVGVHQLPQPAPGFTVRNYGPENYLSFSDSPHGDYRDGPAATARFHHPAAVALGADGTLYVADQDNNCIRVIRPVAPGQP
jgi:sugar lactone lactonase YvrE